MAIKPSEALQITAADSSAIAVIEEYIDNVLRAKFNDEKVFSVDLSCLDSFTRFCSTRFGIRKNDLIERYKQAGWANVRMEGSKLFLEQHQDDDTTDRTSYSK